MAITLLLIAVLGGVFLKGFTEAIGIAVGLVAVYLALNFVVVTVALGHLVANPEVVVSCSRTTYPTGLERGRFGQRNRKVLT